MTEIDGNGAWQHTNIYAADMLLATYDPTGTHFHVVDWLGSRRVQADYLGRAESAYQNLPFGEFATNNNKWDLGATEQHFTGKERDSESGLDYFGARYYASTMGRFLSPDPLWVKADRLLSPQRLNLYAYGANNPLRFTDPTGMDLAIGQCGWGMTTTMCEAAIRNGVPKADRDHIHFVEGDGKNGYKKGQTGILVDKDYKSDSGDFKNLQEAANDHSALGLFNFEPTGFRLQGIIAMPHGNSLWMRDFQNEALRETGYNADLGNGLDGSTFFQDWGHPDATAAYSRDGTTEMYIDAGLSAGELSGTTYHELMHLVLGDFGRLAGQGLHGAPGVDDETKRAQEEGKKNAADQ